MKSFGDSSFKSESSRRGQVKRFPPDAKDVDIPQRNVGNPVAAVWERLRAVCRTTWGAVAIALGLISLILGFLLH